jgi:hypothetical protein
MRFFRRHPGICFSWPTFLLPGRDKTAIVVNESHDEQERAQNRTEPNPFSFSSKLGNDARK